MSQNQHYNVESSYLQFKCTRKRLWPLKLNRLKREKKMFNFFKNWFRHKCIIILKINLTKNQNESWMSLSSANISWMNRFLRCPTLFQLVTVLKRDALSCDALARDKISTCLMVNILWTILCSPFLSQILENKVNNTMSSHHFYISIHPEDNDH